MARIGDPRWNPLFILCTLFGQLVLCAVVLGLTATDIINDFWSIISLASAAVSIFSTIIYLICYATSTLHPLVVLTISIEFMMLWLAASIMQILALVFSDNDGFSGDDDGSFVGCHTPTFDPNSYYSDTGRTYNYTTGIYDYHPPSSTELAEYKTMYDQAVKEQKAACSRGIAGIVFVLLVFISYIWLIVYSAVTRNRTRMPFVRAEKQPLMAEQQQQDQEKGMVGEQQPQMQPHSMSGAGEPRAAGNEHTEDPDRIAVA